MSHRNPPVVCFMTFSAGDWGGASRVIYTNLRGLDRTLLEPIVILPWDGPIVPELDRLGIRHWFWGESVTPDRPISFARAILRALIFFLRERVALVHLNHRQWRSAEAIAAKLLGIPVLIHYHLVNTQTTPTDRLARAGIAVSDYVRRNSEPSALEKFVIYNPIDLNRFGRGVSRRNEFGVAEQSVVVSFMGQIREFKGVQDFISMAHLVGAKNAVFLIAGECRDPTQFPGSYSQDDLARMIGGDPRIRYLGYIDSIEDLYVTSDIVVFPSRWQEPLGLIALEAAAAKKPVVATRVGGIPEAVVDGETGFLVEPADPAALSDCVARLIEQPELRMRFGEAGYARVKRDFSDKPLREFEKLLMHFADARG